MISRYRAPRPAVLSGERPERCGQGAGTLLQHTTHGQRHPGDRCGTMSSMVYTNNQFVFGHGLIMESDEDSNARHLLRTGQPTILTAGTYIAIIICVSPTICPYKHYSVDELADGASDELQCALSALVAHSDHHFTSCYTFCESNTPIRCKSTSGCLSGVVTAGSRLLTHPACSREYVQAIKGEQRCVGPAVRTSYSPRVLDNTVSIGRCFLTCNSRDGCF